MTAELIIQRINNRGTRVRRSSSSCGWGRDRRVRSRTTTTALISWAVTIVCFMCCLEATEALKCVCNPKECDTIRSTDCPGKGLIIWDPCKCCRVCAKTVGESCGGPGGFSGTCEPPLQCVQRLQMKGSGVCLEVPTKSRTLTCLDSIPLEPGCAIVNGKCKCMGWSQTCQSTGLRWDFKNLEECQLNLENLIRTEVDFDEDYPIKVPARSRFRNRSR